MGLHGSLLYSPPAHLLSSMVMVLHQHGHGHSHGHDHKSGDGHGHGHGHGHSHGLSIPIPGFLRRKKVKNTTSDVESGADGRKSTRNINVQAAFIHVIGDLIQSIGVVIAAYIIRFKVKPDKNVCMRFVF